jgi:hypothetical protein
MGAPAKGRSQGENVGTHGPCDSDCVYSASPIRVFTALTDDLLFAGRSLRFPLLVYGC